MLQLQIDQIIQGALLLHVNMKINFTFKMLLLLNITVVSELTIPSL